MLRITTLAAVVQALLVLTACWPTPAPGASPSPVGPRYQAQPALQSGGTALLSDYEYPTTLDPLAATTELELQLSQLSFAPLWGLDDHLVPYPDLAREVPTRANGLVRVGPGGRSMTVDLRLVPGLRWSDGEPITAEDVAFTWRAATDPAGGALVPDGLRRISTVEVRSPTELLWTFQDVYAPYLELGAALLVVPAHRLASVPPAAWPGHPFFQHPDAVSGPFQPLQVTPGRRIVYGANPHYADGRSAPGAYPRRKGPFDHAPRLAGLVFQTEPSKAAMLEDLGLGAVDLSWHLGPPDLPVLWHLRGSAPLVRPGLRAAFFRPTGSLAAEGRLLAGLSLALDRRLLVHDALAGYGLPARGVFPAALPDIERSPLLPSAADQAASRALLTPPLPVLAVLTDCSDPNLAALLEAVVRQWRSLGVPVSAACRPRQQVLATLAKGGPGLALVSDDPGPDPADWARLACNDPTVRTGFVMGERSLDPGRRRAAYATAERAWLAAPCTLPLVELPRVAQVSRRLHNVALSPGPGAVTWNAADWWLQQG